MQKQQSEELNVVWYIAAIVISAVVIIFRRKINSWSDPTSELALRSIGVNLIYFVWFFAALGSLKAVAVLSGFLVSVTVETPTVNNFLIRNYRGRFYWFAFGCLFMVSLYVLRKSNWGWLFMLVLLGAILLEEKIRERVCWTVTMEFTHDQENGNDEPEMVSHRITRQLEKRL